MFFDFDGTLTIGERNGILARNMRPGDVDREDLVDAFGGAERLFLLQETFDELRRRGVMLFVLTTAPAINVYAALNLSNLLEFFKKTPDAEASASRFVGEMDEFGIWSASDAAVADGALNKTHYVRDRVASLGLRPSRAVVIDEDGVVRAGIKKYDAAATMPTPRNGMNIDVLGELMSLAEDE